MNAYKALNVSREWSPAASVLMYILISSYVDAFDIRSPLPSMILQSVVDTALQPAFLIINAVMVHFKVTVMLLVLFTVFVPAAPNR